MPIYTHDNTTTNLIQSELDRLTGGCVQAGDAGAGIVEIDDGQDWGYYNAPQALEVLRVLSREEDRHYSCERNERTNRKNVWTAIGDVRDFTF